MTAVASFELNTTQVYEKACKALVMPVAVMSKDVPEATKAPNAKRPTEWGVRCF